MKKLTLILAALCTSGFAEQQAIAQDDEVDDAGAERCINIRRIRRTKIVDDNNIIFYVSNSKAYHNILPRTCNGLKREDRFSYKTSASQLCDLDNITILMGGARGMQPGRSCGLGLFHPISGEQADALLNPEARGEPEAEVSMPEPEEVGADQDNES